MIRLAIPLLHVSDSAAARHFYCGGPDFRLQANGCRLAAVGSPLAPSIFLVASIRNTCRGFFPETL